MTVILSCGQALVHILGFAQTLVHILGFAQGLVRILGSGQTLVHILGFFPPGVQAQTADPLLPIIQCEAGA